jgi:hypothetical protein
MSAAQEGGFIVSPFIRLVNAAMMRAVPAIAFQAIRNDLEVHLATQQTPDDLGSNPGSQ